MSVGAVLLPVFVQVALTFALLVRGGLARVASVRAGETKLKDIALREPNWPVFVTKVGNAYQNQLEMPVLFYVLVALAMITRQTDLIFVVMSWIFVVARLAHAAIHVTANDVVRRLQAFSVAALILAAMWLIFAIRILTLSGGV